MMRTVKRILSAIICFSVICSGLIFAAVSGADVSGELSQKYYEAAGLLKSIGVWADYMEAQTPEDTITRAQFCDVLAKMVSVGGTKFGGASYFGDVTPETTGYDAINLLVEQGVVSGNTNGTFDPNANINIYQAAKLIVAALGYADYAEANGGYPMGYYMVAAQSKMFENLNGSGESVLSRENAVILLYRALFIGLKEVVAADGNGSLTYEMSKDKNILSENFDIFRVKGRITENEFTSLVGETSVGEHEIKINGVKMDVGDTNARELLGYEVTVYYRHDNDTDANTAVCITDLDKNEILKIDADDIISFTNGEYVYEKDEGNSRRAKVNTDADIIYNGKALTFDENVLIPAEGYVELLKNGSTGGYGTVFITDIKNIVVNTINGDKKLVAGKYGVSAVSFNENDFDSLVIKDTEGNDISLDDIFEWDVLSYTLSADGKIMVATLVREYLSGSVTGIDAVNNDIEIAENDFKISSYYPNYGEYKINLGDKGDFLLDVTGKIIAFIKNESVGFEYGYLIECRDREYKNVEIKLMRGRNGVISLFPVGEYIVLDGDRISSHSNALVSLSDTVVRYQLNSNGEISKLDTTTLGPNEDAEQSLFQSFSMTNGFYCNNNLNGSVLLGGNTIVFMIPSNRQEYDKYKIKNSSYFTNYHRYNIKAYNCQSDYTYADALFLVSDEGDGHGIIDNTYMAIVERVFSTVDEDGSPCKKITYGTKNNIETAIINDVVQIADSTQTMAATDITPGSVIRIGTDSDNYISVIDLLYLADRDLSGGTFRGVATSPNAEFNKVKRFMYGYVYLTKEGVIKLTENDPATMAVFNSDNLEGRILSNFRFIMMLDTSKGKPFVRTAGESDFLDYLHYGDDCVKAIVQTKDANPYAIMIVK